MSLRMRALNGVLRVTARPLLARVPDPVAVRDIFDRMVIGAFRVPPFTLSLRDSWGGVSGRMIRSGRKITRGKIILYLHGGGYFGGSSRTHLALIARISRMAGVEVVAPDYALAPEAPLPAALRDAEAVWDALIARGYAPENIVLAGDSAGGGLALLLLSKLCLRGTPPAGLAAFSPWADLACSGGSYGTNRQSEVVLPTGRLAEALAQVLQGADPKSPDISPLYAEFPDAPPVLIQHSMAEILCDDALAMGDHLRGFGGAVDLQSWPDAPHVWQMFYGIVPEARAALEDAAGRIRGWLNLPPL